MLLCKCRMHLLYGCKLVMDMGLCCAITPSDLQSSVHDTSITLRDGME